jgi:hypothetical protein
MVQIGLMTEAKTVLAVHDDVERKKSLLDMGAAVEKPARCEKHTVAVHVLNKSIQSPLDIHRIKAHVSCFKETASPELFKELSLRTKHDRTTGDPYGLLPSAEVLNGPQ